MGNRKKQENRGLPRPVLAIEQNGDNIVFESARACAENYDVPVQFVIAQIESGRSINKYGVTVDWLYS